MLIATFNCNSVRMRLEIVLAWLEQYRPDVLALQETKVVDELFPAQPFRDAGWEVNFRGQKAYNGVAMITKAKPKKVSFGLGDGDGGESGPRLAYINYGGLHIVNTYVPQGQSLDSDKFQFKLEWYRRLRRYFQRNFKSKRARVLWLGDLNVAPSEIDVHDSKKIWPHVCHCQEVIDTFAEVTAFGFIDLFRKHLPEPQTFTFWDYRIPSALEANRGWRIDHIQATPPVAKTSREVFVDTEPRQARKPSDHTFVAVRLGG